MNNYHITCIYKSIVIIINSSVGFIKMLHSETHAAKYLIVIFLFKLYIFQKETETTLFYKTKRFLGTVIYQVPINTGFDLAIIQSKEILSENLKNIPVCKKECKIGKY